MADNWIAADWPAPTHIRAGTTTRLNGVSRPPFDSFNVAGHVGDQPEAVAGNRARLREKLNLPSEPAWLQQRHGNTVIKPGREQIAPVDSPATADGPAPMDNPAPADSPAPADGAYTDTAGRVCAALTADCIPLLLCNRDGTEVAALHVGWRGLCKRIIQHGLSMFVAAPHELLAWIGPYIHQQNYEVGADVISACLGEGLLSSKGDRFEVFPQENVSGHGDRFETCPQPKSGEDRQVSFSPALRQSRPNHWYLGLGQLVKAELFRHGVEDVYGCNLCTFTRKDLFYSYRRDGVTGRMASLIWMDSEKNR